MKKVLKLAVLTALLSSCGQSASEEAETLRRELETQENTIQQDRQTRDRQVEEQLNQIKNERYERINTEN